MKKAILLCAMLTVAMVYPAVAQVDVGQNGTLKGKVFGDFYWMAQNHNESIEGKNGFWIRRVYLTYEHDLGDSFSSRLRLEMDNPGDFTSSSKMTPVVKDAYLKWSGESHSAYLGIASTPTFGLVEDVWGYRWAEKTPLDLLGWGSSRDFGIKLKGTLDSQGKFGYEAMFGNGNSNGSEFNKGKKVMLATHYEITDDIVFQVYGDYNSLENDQYYYTAQGFLGYTGKQVTAGVLFAHQFRNDTPNIGDVELNMASYFTHIQLNDKMKAVLRLDHLLDPNPDGNDVDYLPFSPNADAIFTFAGLDYRVNDNIHFMPNIETIFYGESDLGGTPNADIMPRFTFFYKF